MGKGPMKDSRLKNELTKEVELKLMSLSDIMKFKKWLDDEEILKLAFGSEEITEGIKLLVRSFKRTFLTSYFRFRTIRYQGRSVGFINFSVIPSTQGKIAKIGIVIGEKELWGKGIGTAALRKFLRHLFLKEGVSAVHLDTAYFNIRAQKAFKKLGFKPFAYDDKRKKIYMELTKEMFLEREAKKEL